MSPWDANLDKGFRRRSLGFPYAYLKCGAGAEKASTMLARRTNASNIPRDPRATAVPLSRPARPTDKPLGPKSPEDRATELRTHGRRSQAYCCPLIDVTPVQWYADD